MRTKPNTRTITLTQGRVALVDESDHEMLLRWTWHANRYGGRGRFCAATTSPCRFGSCRQVLMHRLIMLPDPDQFIDHINHDTLDNRRRNLRICTRSENGRNQRRRSDNSSGYKGVSWNRVAGAWRADIYTDGSGHFLGHFQTLEEAAIAYDRAALETFGEFALPNILLRAGVS